MRDFYHSVNILVKAYLNDTLQHGNCYACAIGNMVADSNKIVFTGTSIFRDKKVWDDRSKTPYWQDVFITTECEQIFSPQQYEGEAKRQIDATGYSWQELAKIEYAFESADLGSNEDDYMFNGLMAVVDVLAEIHNIDLQSKEEAKALFVRH